ncbi:MAG: RsmD family RNA methyltransferase [bacterium]
MRIVSGTCRGRIINPPKNFSARPTTDFAKENLFNILTNRFDFDEMSILDLFSGTGSISFEFASRGAQRVVSIEQNSLHQSFINKTAKELKLNQISSFKTNVFVYLKTCSEKFDLIFADPPYDLDNIDNLPDIIFSKEMLNEGGIFVFEHSKHKNYSSHPNFFEHRIYGSVNFSFFRQQV